jgi:hypothetical protein
LGSWCAQRLEGFGDGTIVVGFGTLVLGFARYYEALSLQAMGDRSGARRAFVRACELSERSGADLWSAYSSLGLAALLEVGTDDSARAELDSLLAHVDSVARLSGSVRLAQMRARAFRNSTG